MADSRLKIVIDALNMAKGELGNLEKELAGAEAQAKKTSGAMEALKAGKEIFTNLTGAVAGFGATWKLAMDFGKAGAELNLMDSKFGNLAQSIGTTGGALRDQLNAQMAGTVSQAQMVEGAVTLMNLGLAKTQGEVVRMSAMSQKLNWDMSILGLTIANESTMRLDALGLSIEDVVGRQKKLVAEGMNTSQAFREAILQAGEAKAAMLGLGSASDNPAAAFKRLDAAATDLADSLKSKLAPWLAKSAEGAALLLTWNDKLSAAQNEHSAQVVKTAASYEEYAREMIRSSLAAEGVDTSQAAAQRRIASMEITNEKVISTYHIMSREQFDNSRAADALGRATQANIPTFQEYTSAVSITADQLNRLKQSTKEQETALSMLKVSISGAVGNEYQSFISRQAELAARLDETKAKYGEWSPIYKETTATVAKELQKNAEEHELATKRILLGFVEQRLALDGWTAKEIDAYQAVARQLGLIDDATWNMVGGVNEALSALDAGGSIEDFLAKVNAIKNSSLGLSNASGADTQNPGQRRGGEQGFASGGSFVVPPGYPGDSYRVNVTTGERVSVQPASNVNNTYHNSFGGDTVYIQDTRAMALYMAGKRQARTLGARYG